MSTADILAKVSLASYIIAGVLLVIAIFLWFFFKIPSVMGDLSGRTAKKSIEKMRQTNAGSGNKSYRSSATNVARGKLTETMAPPPITPAAPQPQAPIAESAHPETTLLADNKADTYVSAPTDLLDNATTLLSTEELPAPVPRPIRTGGKAMTMIKEIMLIHTDEVIG